MSKVAGYVMSVLFFILGLVLIDFFFNSGFFEELNISNAFLTVFVGYLVVDSLEHKEQRDNDTFEYDYQEPVKSKGIFQEIKESLSGITIKGWIVLVFITLLLFGGYLFNQL